MEERCPYCNQPASAEVLEAARAGLDKERNAAVSAERVKNLEAEKHWAAAIEDLRLQLSGKRVGRPTQAPAGGERVQIGVQVSPKVKARLEAAAERNRRSLSREAENRLERSADREDLLSEVLTLVYGKEFAGLLMMIGFAMRELDHRFSWEGNDRWMSDPRDYDQIKRAVVTILEAARPKGGRRQQVRSPADLGFQVGNLLVLAVRGQTKAALRLPLESMRRLLGPLVHRLAKVRLSALRRESPPQRGPTKINNPAALGMAVVTAAASLEDLRNRLEGSGGLISEEGIKGIAEVLERYLKNFLVPDWQQKRWTAGADDAAGAAELDAEIRKRVA